jgi:hypothetical protein
MHSRNAARVLPDPVGAEIKTSRPAEISFQAAFLGCRAKQTTAQTIPGLVGETSWRVNVVYQIQPLHWERPTIYERQRMEHRVRVEC